MNESINNSIEHAKPGLLSMASYVRNVDESQFFITLGAAPSLDGLHVVFGVYSC